MSRQRGTRETQRQRKCLCLACGYLVYTSQKWIDTAIPVCPDPSCAAYLKPMQADAPPYMVAPNSEDAAHSVAAHWDVKHSHVNQINQLRDELNATSEPATEGDDDVAAA